MTRPEDHSEYRMSPFRRALLGLHRWGGRFGSGVERARDAAIYAGYAVAVLVGVGGAGWTWFPLTNSGWDFGLWIMICASVSAVAIGTLRYARRRRIGDKPSKQLSSTTEVGALAMAFWAGLIALIGLTRQLISPEPVEGGIVLGLIALAGLGVPAYAALSYVTERGDEEPDTF